jgi:hypothetical protein
MTEEMKEIKVVKIVDRTKVARTLHAMLDCATDIFSRPELTKEDYGKMRAMRAFGSALNAGVSLIQQETSQQRNMLIMERMKQLGYGENPKSIEG